MGQNDVAERDCVVEVDGSDHPATPRYEAGAGEPSSHASIDIATAIQV